MYSFLDIISKNAICHFLELTSNSLREKDLSQFSRDTIYRILYSLYGYDLLYEKRIRRILVESLSKNKVKELASELGLNSERKIYDLAIAISNIPWKQNSRIIWIFSNYFFIPHEYLPTKSTRVPSVENVEPFSPPPKLFDYQQILVDDLFYFLTQQDKNYNSCMLQLPTGAGKTRTAMEALVLYCNHKYTKDYPLTVLWIAHTEELCEQAIETFRRTWQSKGQYENKIIRFWGSFNFHVEEMGYSFIVAGYQKVAQLVNSNFKQYQKLLKILDLVIVDEAHKALAPTINSLLNDIKKQKRSNIIGLTATPGRGVAQQKENEQLAKIFDRNLFYPHNLGESPIATLQQRGILAKIKREVLNTNLDFEIPYSSHKNSVYFYELPTLVLKRLAKNKKRNQLIVDQVIKQIKSCNPTLVFACTVEHSKELAIKIAEKGYKAAAIDYKMRRNLRRHVENDFKNGLLDVLFNFGVLTTGFDAPNVKTIIITRPTTSIVLYSQMVGRGLRGNAVGGSEVCNLIDLKDNFINFGNVSDMYLFFENFWENQV